MKIEMRNLSDGSIVWSKTEELGNDFDYTRENLTFSNQGDKIAYSYQNEIVVSSSTDGNEIKRIVVCSWYYEMSNALLGLSFDKNGEYIYTTLHDGTVRKYDLKRLSPKL